MQTSRFDAFLLADDSRGESRGGGGMHRTTSPELPETHTAVTALMTVGLFVT